MQVSIRNWLFGPFTLLGENTAILHNTPVPHSWLPGDRVDPISGEVISRKLTTRNTLVGILDCVNRVGQGFTSRNVPLYMWHPLDPGYPPFVVSSTRKYTQNMLVSVSFEHWDAKWPRGGIQHVFGPVGDKVAERAALVRNAVGRHTTLPIEPEAVYPIHEPSHEDTVWDTVFNIDPEGCRDVDDVIAWRPAATSGATEVAIAIADAAAWVLADSSMDMAAYMKGQTFYDTKGTVIEPMLPHAISSGAASLLCDGVARPVLALVFTIQDNTVVSHTWKLCKMVVDHAYTYESIYTNADICKRLPIFLTSICRYSDVRVGGGGSGDADAADSHAWIASAMIVYNVWAARTLRRANKGLLRTHAGHSASTWQALAEQTGCADIAWFGSTSGAYTDSAVDDSSHSGLGVECYTHASSPLRRYADLANQRWLKHILFGVPGAPPPVANVLVAHHLNERARAAKALDRDIWFLSNLCMDAITETQGYTLTQKTDGVWSVYVPAWKRKVRCSIADTACTSGIAVRIRAYTDLTSTQWAHRLVCSGTIVSP